MRRRSASPSDSATRPRAGATTCTGTSSSTRAERHRAQTVPPKITSVQPLRAVEGGRVTIRGSGLDEVGAVALADVPVRVSFARADRLIITIPTDIEGGQMLLRVEE